MLTEVNTVVDVQMWVNVQMRGCAELQIDLLNL